MSEQVLRLLHIRKIRRTTEGLLRMFSWVCVAVARETQADTTGNVHGAFLRCHAGSVLLLAEWEA